MFRLWSGDIPAPYRRQSVYNGTIETERKRKVGIMLDKFDYNGVSFYKIKNPEMKYSHENGDSYVSDVDNGYIRYENMSLLSVLCDFGYTDPADNILPVSWQEINRRSFWSGFDFYNEHGDGIEMIVGFDEETDEDIVYVLKCMVVVSGGRAAVCVFDESGEEYAYYWYQY